MASADPERRLIVNADDFGARSETNHAIIEAHCKGILTSASLMVTGNAVDEAVELARKHPALGVGLHLTLVCGRPACEPARVPGLTGGHPSFPDNAVRAGFQFFFDRSIHSEIELELKAQFDRFRATGLPLDHVNGHLNFHLHPVVFRFLTREAGGLGIRSMRLTRDPWLINARLAAGRWIYRTSHAIIFSLLSSRARRELRRRGIRHTQRVFGLLQNARVDEAYVIRLIPRLPPGDSELYSHPSLIEFKPELDALVSSRVRSLIREHRVKLIRYQDL